MDSLRKSYNLSSVNGLSTLTQLTTLRPITEFYGLQKLIDANDYNGTMDFLSKIISVKEEKYESQRRYRFIKGGALYIRGQIFSAAGYDANAFEDYQASVLLGNELAIYNAAVLTTVLLRESDRDSNEYRERRNELNSLMVLGSELGIPACMEMLAEVLKNEGNKDGYDYWTFMQVVNDTNIVTHLQFLKFYTNDLDTNEQKHLNDIFKMFSVVGGTVLLVKKRKP